MNNLIAELKNDGLTFNVEGEYLHVFYADVWFKIDVRPDYYILYDETNLAGVVGYYKDCSSLLAAIYEY